MGAFIVNLHVRTENSDALVRELRNMRIARCYATPSKSGWASLYEEQASTQDEQWIRVLGSDLSGRLHAPVIAFLIHDSDFVCYWLFDDGKLLDEFNSCPDYFEEGGGPSSVPAATTVRGRRDRLRSVCRAGVELEDIDDVLGQEPIFAEEQLEALASLLGVNPERALTDFRDFGRDIGPDDLGAVFIGTDGPSSSSGGQSNSPTGRNRFGRDSGSDTTGSGSGRLNDSPRIGPLSLFRGDEDESTDSQDESDDEGAELSQFVPRGLDRLFGMSRPTADVDPRAAELVQTALDGNVPRIEQLVHEGADVNAIAPLTVNLAKQPPGLGRIMAGMAPTFNVFPLLVAAGNNQLEAARKLIELGADVNAVHPLFGTALHAAATSGLPQMTQLLVQSGADVNARNPQGQTALEAVRTARQVFGHYAKLSPVTSMVSAQLARMLPTTGWDECERLLNESTGQE